MNIKDYKKIFMSGIGGISMSGIALILKKWNFEIVGSDAVQSKQTDLLTENGIKVIIGQKEDNVDKTFNLFIYSAAIKENNPEYVKAKELGIMMIERGEFLGELTKLFNDKLDKGGCPYVIHLLKVYEVFVKIILRYNKYLQKYNRKNNS